MAGNFVSLFQIASKREKGLLSLVLLLKQLGVSLGFELLIIHFELI